MDLVGLGQRPEACKAEIMSEAECDSESEPVARGVARLSRVLEQPSRESFVLNDSHVLSLNSGQRHAYR